MSLKVLQEKFANKEKAQAKTSVPSPVQKPSSSGSGRSISSSAEAAKKALSDNPSSLTKMLNSSSTNPAHKAFIESALSLKESVANKASSFADKKNEKIKELTSRLNETETGKPAEEKPKAKESSSRHSFAAEFAQNNPDVAPAEKEQPKTVGSKNSLYNEYLVNQGKEALPVEEKDTISDGIKRLGQWAKNVGSAAATSYASGLSGAERVAYEMGSGVRSKAAEQRMADLEPQIARAKQAYEETKGTEYEQTAKEFLDKLQREYDAYKTGYSDEVTQGTIKGTSDIVNSLSEQSAKYTEAAKDVAGNTKLGNVLTDAAVSGLQSAGDRLIGFGLGGKGSSGLSLGAMGLRVFGQSAQEAANEGATLRQQIGYGAANALTEIGTEGMFDALSEVPALAKAGWANDAVEKIVAKYAKTPAGKTALRALFSSLGEAAEEGVSGTVDPALKAIYQGKDAFKGYNKKQVGETLYSMLVGGVSGAGGAAANILLGGNAKANQKIQVADAVAKARGITFNEAYDLISQNETGTTTSEEIELADPELAETIEQGAEELDAKVEAQKQETERRTSGEERAEAQAPTAKAETVNPFIPENSMQNDGAVSSSDAMAQAQAAQANEEYAQNQAEIEQKRENEAKIDAVEQMQDRSENATPYETKTNPFIPENSMNNEGAVSSSDAMAQERAKAETEEYQAQQEEIQQRQENEAKIDAVEAAQDRAERENPIIESVQPMQEQERRTSGEERAEQQAPEAPKNPLVKEPSEAVNKNGLTESEQAEYDESVKSVAELEDALKDINDFLSKHGPNNPNYMEYQQYAEEYNTMLNYAKNTRDRYKQRINDFTASEHQRKMVEKNDRAVNPLAETHIDNRTSKSVGSTEINAFQYDNPEVKPFYKKAAAVLMADAAYSGDSRFVTAREGTGILKSELINTLMQQGLTIDRIYRACESIVYDKGGENYADAKRVELILDKMLTEGYEPADPSLPTFKADADYLNVKGQLDGGTSREDTLRNIAAKRILDASVIENPDFTMEDALEEAQRNYEETGYFDTITKDGLDVAPGREEGDRNIEDVVAGAEQFVNEKYQGVEPKKPAKTVENNNDSVETAHNTYEQTSTKGAFSSSADAYESDASSKYNDLVEKTGRIEPGEKPARDKAVPVEAGSGKVGEAVRTVVEANATPEERIHNIENAVVGGKFSYVSVGNTELEGAARSAIDESVKKNGWEYTVAEWIAKSKEGRVTPDLVAQGAILLNNAANSKSVTGGQYIDMLIAYNDIAHNAATSLQAQRLLKTLSPEGKMVLLQKRIDALNKAIAPKANKGKKSAGNSAASVAENVISGNAENVTNATNATNVTEENNKNNNNNQYNQNNATVDANIKNVGGNDQFGFEQVLNPEQETEATVNFNKNEVGKGTKSKNVKGQTHITEIIHVNEELANKFLAADSDEVRDQTLDEIIKDVAKQVPSTFSDKLHAIRYLNMLGNLKTQSRNIAGNIFMAVTTKAKNTIRSTLETATRKAGTEKTYSAFHTRDQMKAARADFKNNKDIQKTAMGDKKYTSASKQIAKEIEDNRTIFKFGDNKLTQALGIANKQGLLGKGLTMYQNAVGWLMNDFGDQTFVSLTYSDALAGWMKAHNISGEQWAAMAKESDTNPLADHKMVDEARAFAIKQAQEATFRDNNALSEAVSRIGRTPNANGIEKIGGALLEGVLPFRKTPANVALRMEEYSPLGLINTAVKAAQKAAGNENITGNDIIDQAAKAMTGTGIAALGFVLAASGHARGKNPDDKEDRFEKLQGFQDYSITIGNKNYTLDWASPSAAPFFMGVAAYDLYEDGTFTLSDIGKITKSLLDPMLNMSMISGVNDLLQNIANYGSDSSSIGQLLFDTAWGYITQATSNTLLGQAEQFFEDNRQTYYTNPDNPFFDTATQAALAKQANKTPGIDYQNADYIDAWGRKDKNDENLLARAFNTFINPGYSNDLDTSSTAADSELQRLYEYGADKDDFPNVFPQTVSRNETVNGTRLSPEEYETYATTKGQKSLSLVNDLMNSETYSAMTDDDKAEAISQIYSFSGYLAASEIAKQRGEDYNNSQFSLLMNGKDAPGTSNDRTALKEENFIPYISFHTGYENAVDNEDYSAIDKYISEYNKLDANTKQVLTERSTDIKGIMEYSDIGLGSKSYYSVKKGIDEAQGELDKSGTNGGDVRFLGLLKADIPESEKRTLIEKGDYLSKMRKTSYDTLSPYGLSLEDIYNFYADADYRVSKDTGKVYTGASNLSAEAVAYGLSQVPGLTDEQRSEAFNALKAQWHNSKYNDWKNYTYESEIEWINSGRSYYIYGRPGTGGQTDIPLNGSSSSKYSGGKGGYYPYKKRSWSYSKGGSSTKAPSVKKNLTNLLASAGSSSNASLAKMKNKSYTPKTSKTSSTADYFRQSLNL